MNKKLLYLIHSLIIHIDSEIFEGYHKNINVNKDVYSLHSKYTLCFTQTATIEYSMII